MSVVFNFVADGALIAYGIVIAGSAAGQVAQGADASAPFLGVTGILPAVDTERADVTQFGTAEVTLGGTVAVGAPFTSDANGKAIALTGEDTEYVVGYLNQVGGVAGDIVPCIVCPYVSIAPAGA